MLKFSRIAARSLVVLPLLATLPGCIPQMVLNSEDHQHYSDYVVKTEQINTEREKDGLQPDKIMTFNEWKGTAP
ncbi:hypothetical protein [Acidocella aromatica]|uniref:Lipoprotein n=1 Tax=Acidocella aromatica TaxID=1303579 RepID=A0A840V986_9PROT|nr:hypothetical protein [Acidocella aromatica]MBB5372283.1 hypothetical protein [Acidocella aromatica]